MIDHSHAERYLSTIFGGVKGRIEIRLIPIDPNEKVHSVFCADPNDALGTIEREARDGINVYVGIASRSRSAGSKKDLQETQALWVDCDFEEAEAAKRDAFVENLERFSPRPSMIVDSGYGLHVYWRLSEPYDLQTPESIERSEHILKGLTAALDGDRSATDASRVLRVPGTTNYPNTKKQQKGRVVRPTAILEESDRAYTLDEFSAYESQGKAATVQQAQAPYAQRPWDGSLPASVQQVLARSAHIRGRFHGDTTGLNDTSESAVDQSIASLLARNSIEGTAIEEALRYRRKQAGLDPKHDGYYVRTVGKGLAGVSQSPSPPSSGVGQLGQGNTCSSGSNGFARTSLEDLLAEPEEETEWLVEDRLPMGGVSLLVAKPKVGKSTLARSLAVAVAQGTPFLGWETVQGGVFYLALEEKRSEVSKHFIAMGATGKEPIWISDERAPEDAAARLQATIESESLVLIIIDTFQRFSQVKDLNDYAEVTLALDPILQIARAKRVHVLLLHHGKKAGGASPGDETLGSTAIFGTVDTLLRLQRRGERRFLSTQQRYGPSLEETILELDPQTRTPALRSSVRASARTEIAGRIEEVLRASTGPLTEKELRSRMQGNHKLKGTVLRDLVKEGRVMRTGKGGKSDPYRYQLVEPSPATVNAQSDDSPSDRQVAAVGAHGAPANHPGDSREGMESSPEGSSTSDMQHSSNDEGPGSSGTATSVILIPPVPEYQKADSAIISRSTGNYTGTPPAAKTSSAETPSVPDSSASTSPDVEKDTDSAHANFGSDRVHFNDPRVKLCKHKDSACAAGADARAPEHEISAINEIAEVNPEDRSGRDGQGAVVAREL
jgi:hypothetical protein